MHVPGVNGATRTTSSSGAARPSTPIRRSPRNTKSGLGLDMSSSSQHERLSSLLIAGKDSSSKSLTGGQGQHSSSASSTSHHGHKIESRVGHHYHNDGDDLENNSNGHNKHSSQSQQQQQQQDRKEMARRMLTLIRTIALLCTNIAAWYATNGFNGISMQSFATKTRAAYVAPGAASDTYGTTIPPLPFVLLVTSSVTAMQLLLGACVGWVMLMIYSTINQSTVVVAVPPLTTATGAATTAGGGSGGGGISIGGVNLVDLLTRLATAAREYARRVFALPGASASAKTSRQGETIAAFLHTVGSVCTNLGFMYGSASLIQIIKLLEPFETLLLTKLILDDESKFLSVGVIASMTTTVGGAISLIKSRNSAPHPNAVIFAILSGMTLSSRNVLQRRQHGIDAKQQQQQQQKQHHHPLATNKSHDDGDDRDSSSPSKPTMDTSARGAANATSVTASTATTTSAVKQDDSASKLENALLQFTRISFLSGCLLSSMVILMLIGALAVQNPQGHRIFTSLADGTLDSGVLVWHPLYNAFSMITLGFCSALTHSLLNAGKRVFAILMAIVWFHESFTRKTVAGLVLVSIGAYWYTVETKKKGGETTQNEKYMKAAVPLILLTLNSIMG